MPEYAGQDYTIWEPVLKQKYAELFTYPYSNGIHVCSVTDLTDNVPTAIHQQVGRSLDALSAFDRLCEETPPLIVKEPPMELLERYVQAGWVRPEEILRAVVINKEEKTASTLLDPFSAVEDPALPKVFLSVGEYIRAQREQASDITDAIRGVDKPTTLETDAPPKEELEGLEKLQEAFTNLIGCIAPGTMVEYKPHLYLASEDGRFTHPPQCPACAKEKPQP